MIDETPHTADIAEVSESIQTRCPNMSRHFAGDLLMPCSECYSLRVTSERLPEWQPDVRWHERRISPGEQHD